MKRPLIVYIPLVLFLVGVGLLSRSFPDKVPHWVTFYCGDFIWAMGVYFICCLAFRLKTGNAILVALALSYAIEITQLFHPPWLESLRSIKVFALVLGFKFLWSDLVAYTLGIFLAAIVDKRINTTCKNI